MDRDLGTLEPGKLADLVVLDANPLENIRDTDKVRSVMLGGRLYDAATLNEQVTGTRQRQPYWWEESNDPKAGSTRASAHAH
jgi:cytosine/adenosine deaminase-related metal-dependent hydrolase